jgi:hypothetical protein
MSWIILISLFGALLAGCGTQSADPVQKADEDTWAHARQACAEVGIDPGSDTFSQCVVDLHDTVWGARGLYGS